MHWINCGTLLNYLLLGLLQYIQLCRYVVRTVIFTILIKFIQCLCQYIIVHSLWNDLAFYCYLKTNQIKFQQKKKKKKNFFKVTVINPLNNSKTHTHMHSYKHTFYDNLNKISEEDVCWRRIKNNSCCCCCIF